MKIFAPRLQTETRFVFHNAPKEDYQTYDGYEIEGSREDVNLQGLRDSVLEGLETAPVYGLVNCNTATKTARIYDSNGAEVDYIAEAEHVRIDGVSGDKLEISYGPGYSKKGLMYPQMIYVDKGQGSSNPSTGPTSFASSVPKSNLEYPSGGKFDYEDTVMSTLSGRIRMYPTHNSRTSNQWWNASDVAMVVSDSGWAGGRMHIRLEDGREGWVWKRKSGGTPIIKRVPGSSSATETYQPEERTDIEQAGGTYEGGADQGGTYDSNEGQTETTNTGLNWTNHPDHAHVQVLQSGENTFYQITRNGAVESYNPIATGSDIYKQVQISEGRYVAVPGAAQVKFNPETGAMDPIAGVVQPEGPEAPNNDQDQAPETVDNEENTEAVQEAIAAMNFGVDLEISNELECPSPAYSTDDAGTTWIQFTVQLYENPGTAQLIRITKNDGGVPTVSFPDGGERNFEIQGKFLKPVEQTETIPPTAPEWTNVEGKPNLQELGGLFRIEGDPTGAEYIASSGDFYFKVTDKTPGQPVSYDNAIAFKYVNGAMVEQTVAESGETTEPAPEIPQALVDMGVDRYQEGLVVTPVEGADASFQIVLEDADQVYHVEENDEGQSVLSVDPFAEPPEPLFEIKNGRLQLVGAPEEAPEGDYDFLEGVSDEVKTDLTEADSEAFGKLAANQEVTGKSGKIYIVLEEGLGYRQEADGIVYSVDGTWAQIPIMIEGDVMLVPVTIENLENSEFTIEAEYADVISAEFVVGDTTYVIDGTTIRPKPVENAEGDMETEPGDLTDQFIRETGLAPHSDSTYVTSLEGGADAGLITVTFNHDGIEGEDGTIELETQDGGASWSVISESERFSVDGDEIIYTPVETAAEGSEMEDPYLADFQELLQSQLESHNVYDEGVDFNSGQEVDIKLGGIDFSGKLYDLNVDTPLPGITGERFGLFENTEDGIDAQVWVTMKEDGSFEFGLDDLLGEYDVQGPYDSVADMEAGLQYLFELREPVFDTVDIAGDGLVNSLGELIVEIDGEDVRNALADETLEYDIKSGTLRIVHGEDDVSEILVYGNREWEQEVREELALPYPLELLDINPAVEGLADIEAFLESEEFRSLSEPAEGASFGDVTRFAFNSDNRQYVRSRTDVYYREFADTVTGAEADDFEQNENRWWKHLAGEEEAMFYGDVDAEEGATLVPIADAPLSVGGLTVYRSAPQEEGDPVYLFDANGEVLEMLENGVYVHEEGGVEQYIILTDDGAEECDKSGALLSQLRTSFEALLVAPVNFLSEEDSKEYSIWTKDDKSDEITANIDFNADGEFVVKVGDTEYTADNLGDILTDNFSEAIDAMKKVRSEALMPLGLNIEDDGAMSLTVDGLQFVPHAEDGATAPTSLAENNYNNGLWFKNEAEGLWIGVDKNGQLMVDSMEVEQGDEYPLDKDSAADVSKWVEDQVEAGKERVIKARRESLIDLGLNIEEGAMSLTVDGLVFEALGEPVPTSLLDNSYNIELWFGSVQAGLMIGVGKEGNLLVDRVDAEGMDEYPLGKGSAEDVTKWVKEQIEAENERIIEARTESLMDLGLNIEDDGAMSLTIDGLRFVPHVEEGATAPASLAEDNLYGGLWFKNEDEGLWIGVKSDGALYVDDLNENEDDEGGSADDEIKKDSPEEVIQWVKESRETPTLTTAEIRVNALNEAGFELVQPEDGNPSITIDGFELKASQPLEGNEKQYFWFGDAPLWVGVGKDGTLYVENMDEDGADGDGDKTNDREEKDADGVREWLRQQRLKIALPGVYPVLDSEDGIAGSLRIDAEVQGLVNELRDTESNITFEKRDDAVHLLVGDESKMTFDFVEGVEESIALNERIKTLLKELSESTGDDGMEAGDAEEVIDAL